MSRRGRSNFPEQATGYFIAEMIVGLARAIAMTIEVFLHCDFGHFCVGCGLMGVFIIFMFTSVFPGQNPYPMFLFGVVYGVRWLFISVPTVIRYWRGKNLPHARYNGRPYLWTLLSSWKEMNVKHLEAAMVIALGFGVHYLNRPLGDYLMCAALLVLARGYHFDTQQRDRAVTLNDCVIEQEMIVERFRDMRGR